MSFGPGLALNAQPDRAARQFILREESSVPTGSHGASSSALGSMASQLIVHVDERKDLTQINGRKLWRATLQKPP